MEQNIRNVNILLTCADDRNDDETSTFMDGGRGNAIELRVKFHHFCSRVNTSFNKSGDIKIKYISTKKQIADIFTMPIDADSFFTLRKMLSGW